MIERVQFRNFKVLRNAELPLGAFTLIVGPNGSGKSTALLAFELLSGRATASYESLLSCGVPPAGGPAVDIVVIWGEPFVGARSHGQWMPGQNLRWQHSGPQQILQAVRVYSLDASLISTPVGLNPKMELDRRGHALPGVLDRLRDEEPERFEALNEELGRMLPEFDRILFDTPGANQRSILLRTRSTGYRIPAASLSQGTLLALAILCLAYLPSPPPLVGLEEPDRGIHPRLLRHIRDALYRLAYPQSFHENRGPVQVVATTHSPYFLDLFRDHPDQIIIAERVGLEARFERLVERPDIEEILGDAPLGEVWYSGVLGGGPANS